MSQNGAREDPSRQMPEHEPSPGAGTWLSVFRELQKPLVGLKQARATEKTRQETRPERALQVLVRDKLPYKQ